MLHIVTKIIKHGMQLFLMKRGGQEIYVGPVGRHSCELIKYFEVRCRCKQKLALQLLFPIFKFCSKTNLFFKKGINGVNKIKDGYNPATWMLEVTSSAQEMVLGVDFTEVYHNSDRS